MFNQTFNNESKFKQSLENYYGWKQIKTKYNEWGDIMKCKLKNKEISMHCLWNLVSFGCDEFLYFDINFKNSNEYKLILEPVFRNPWKLSK